MRVCIHSHSFKWLAPCVPGEPSAAAPCDAYCAPDARDERRPTALRRFWTPVVTTRSSSTRARLARAALALRAFIGARDDVLALLLRAYACRRESVRARATSAAQGCLSPICAIRSTAAAVESQWACRKRVAMFVKFLPLAAAMAAHVAGVFPRGYPLSRCAPAGAQAPSAATAHMSSDRSCLDCGGRSGGGPSW